MTDTETIEAKVRERVGRLPPAVWDCERCDGHSTMELRRSSLNEQFYADDVMLKCSRCRAVATHGIPFRSPAAFEAAREARDSRVYDFAQDAPDPRERLEALGYLGKAATEE